MTSVGRTVDTGFTTACKRGLRTDKIRIYSMRTKYLLVNADDTVFMMFEPIKPSKDGSNSSDRPNICVVDFYIRQDISKFPGVKRVYFDQLTDANIQYIHGIYASRKNCESSATSYSERVALLQKHHNISETFAKLLSRLPGHTFNVTSDIREANFYLSHMEEWRFLLKFGTMQEKRYILQKLLPQATYHYLQVNDDPFKMRVVINEVFTII